MNKRDLLGQIDFGQRIAEEEGAALAGYFVETDNWRDRRRNRCRLRTQGLRQERVVLIAGHAHLSRFMSSRTKIPELRRETFTA